MRKYDITDIFDRVDEEKYNWLKMHLNDNQWTISNEGFLIDAYYLRFTDPVAETLYLLVWP